MRVHAGQQRAVGVRDLDFYQHGAAGGIERIRGARDGAREVAPGQVRDAQARRLTGPYGTGIGLRDVDVSAQRAGLRDTEEKRAAGIDQRADIDVAQGDDSVERGLHHAVGLHLIQARHVGFRGGHVAALDCDGFFERLHAGELGLVLGLILVVFLLRDDAPGAQAAPALRGHAGELQVGFALLVIGERLIERGLRLLQIGLGLANLLVQLGRFDLGHGLAGFGPGLRCPPCGA